MLQHSATSRSHLWLIEFKIEMTTQQSLCILLIEDDDIDASLVERFLQNNREVSYTIQHASSLAEARRALEVRTFNLILSDLSLPDSDSNETIASLRAINTMTPIVALTGHDDEEFGLNIIRAGASDYIPKSQLNRMILTRTISFAVERSRFVGIEATNQLLESKNERLAELYSMSQQFVDNVSHDFRTPLTVIREFASILRDEIEGPLNQKQKNRLSSLISRADELASMVDDLLDTSRLESGLIRTFRCENDANDIIQRVASMLEQRAESKQVEISVEDVPEGQLIFCDEEKLRRVLINLIVNAIKFTQQGGKVRIFTRRFSKHQLEIVVEDNGPGIPAAGLEKIFERFRKLETHNRMASCKGFGLGLSIARSLASLNLGELRVQSEDGVGSQFSVLIPFSNTEAILDSFLEQRLKNKVGSGDLSLTEVSAVGDVDDDALAAVDEFLRSSVKSFDLTIRKSDDRWTILSCNNEASLRQMYVRLEEEWADLKRNCIRVALPDVVFAHIATSTVLEAKRELISHFEMESDGPNKESAATKSEDVTPDAESPNTGARILVIEDEAELSNALEARLSSAGYQISQAYDGIAGVEMAVATVPDMILLDIRMPNLDGLAVLRLMQQIPSLSNIPVLVLSASLQDKNIALDNGALHFIQKPYKSEAVVSAIEKLLPKSNTETCAESKSEHVLELDHIQ